MILASRVNTVLYQLAAELSREWDDDTYYGYRAALADVADRLGLPNPLLQNPISPADTEDIRAKLNALPSAAEGARALIERIETPVGTYERKV